MNSVWIVFVAPHPHERSIHGCYDSEEAANEAIEAMHPSLKADACVEEYPVHGQKDDL